MTRYYAETSCEHGRQQAHGVAGVIHGEGVPECNGGSRVLLDVEEPDYEAAKVVFEREFPCHCDPAFTDRNRHSSDCVFDESDAIYLIVDAAIGDKLLIDPPADTRRTEEEGIEPCWACEGRGSSVHTYTANCAELDPPTEED